MTSDEEATIRAAKEAIAGLLADRDFLGSQLLHANGGMSDEHFNEVSERYIEHKRRHVGELESLIVGLMSLSDRVDEDVIAAAFRCDIADARKAMGNLPGPLGVFFATRETRSRATSTVLGDG